MTKVQILVVEDEIEVARVIQEYCEAFGYEVPAIVRSGEEALRSIAARAPDLVLMDVHLVGTMDGVETAKEIRARFNLPVVYLTGYADEDTTQRALHTDPSGYLVKPFNIRELRTTIELALYKHRMEENRTRLIERVMMAQEEERRWIARELHDEASQSLTSLLLGLRMIEDAHSLKRAKAHAEQLRHIAVQILDNLGRLARGLHPSVLDDLGLVAALTRYAKDYAQSCGIAVDIHTQGMDASRLPSLMETAVYRIVQEALTNIAKHAHAKTVNIVVMRSLSEIQAIVADDGCGFDVETTLQTAATLGRLGLHGMHERAALLRGWVRIESKEGNGTTVSVHLPVDV